MRQDLDDAIQGWPYDPEPGEVLAREVRAETAGRSCRSGSSWACSSSRSAAGPTACGRMGSPRISTTSAIAPPAGASAGRQGPAVGDVGQAVRRGRPRIRPVQPPARRLAGAAPLRQGHPGRRSHARLDGLHPAARQRGGIHRLPRAAPRARALPSHPGRHHPGPGSVAATRTPSTPCATGSIASMPISTPGGIGATRANPPTPP